jgi:hypothetical protein
MREVRTSSTVSQTVHQEADLMAAYLLVALMVWTGYGENEMKPWAEAMSAVCTSQADCTLLASQAFVEGGFAAEVRDERCNNGIWRSRQVGWWRKSCDSGFAWGPWQIHDSRLQGTSPEYQASVAVTLIRNHPRLWTTWAKAKSHATWWIAKHPITP